MEMHTESNSVLSVYGVRTLKNEFPPHPMRVSTLLAGTPLPALYVLYG